ncbi:MAG: hypothetical protein OEM62_04865 [Acidobacteriota bacterium]|nr:hypothetical protein [Acidobacteriota bacterium]
MEEQHHIDTQLTHEQALQAVAQASEIWGATWERQGAEGRLHLPVLAGLRHGLLSGRVWIEPAPQGSRVIFRVDDSHFRLHWTALAILVVGAAGGVAATLWPFFPSLLGVAPLAVVVALAAWVLVASRLRTSTAEDFLDIVAGSADTEHTSE